MLGRVERGGLGVAVDDRLVDHAVLGGVDARAAGRRRSSRRAGAATAAGPSARRRVGEREQDRVAGHRGELAVEAGGRRRSSGARRVVGSPTASIAASRLSRLGVAAARAARRARRRAARAARAPRARRTGWRRAAALGRVERERRRVGGDERAGAGARLDDAVDLQRGDRLAHAGAADLERPGELALGRQPRARRQQAAGDVGAEALGDLLVALGNPQRLEDNWSTEMTAEARSSRRRRQAPPPGSPPGQPAVICG